MRGSSYGRLSLEQHTDFRNYAAMVDMAMRGEIEYTRKQHQQHYSGGVLEDEYLSDMSIKVFIEFLNEDKMSLYMR